MRKLARYLKYFKIEVTIGPLFKFLEAVFELIVPLVMAKIIDIGIAGNDKSYVLKSGALMVLLGVLGLCFALICQYLASKASQGVGTMIRDDMFSHINALSHAEIDKIGTTSLITRMTNDVNQIQVAVAMLIRLVVRAPFLVIGATVMAIMIDVKLSMIFLVMAVLVALVLYFIMSRSIPFYRVIQKKLDKVSFITRENLIGSRVVRAFTKQEKEKEKFNNASDDLADTAIKVGKLSAILNPLNLVILNFAIVAIIWFGGFQVDNGELTQGKVIALVNYMTQISIALVVVANLVVVFTKGAASAARINEVFDLTSSVNNNDKNMNDVAAKGEAKIEFRDVSFSYPNSPELSLMNINFRINAGETIGIIGGTGSGKTTLLQLMPRFYDATSGNVLVDGIDVRDIDKDALRHKFGIVPQKAVLFTGTIKENLQWGKEDITDDEAFRAIEMAQASEFVNELPKKLDSKMIQGGKSLSGGQRQRMSIARAIARNPEILVLDDSFSALDYATDAKLRASIAKLKKNSEDNVDNGLIKPMTVVIVSQRCNTVKNADNIIVMDDGKVAGIGKHDELFESCELYREIYLSQLKKEEE